MQFRIKKSNKNRVFIVVFKVLIIVLIVTYIFFRLKEEKDLGLRLSHEAKLLFKQNAPFLLIFPLLLTFINWSLEAYKWKILANKLGEVNFLTALRGVLAGLSIAFITPHSIGDFMGRMWHLDYKNRLESVGGILLGRLSQSLATYFFGGFGVLVLFKELFQMQDHNLFIIGFLCILLWISIFSFLLYGRSTFVKLLHRILGKRINKYFTILKKYDRKEVVKVIIVAFLRYMVFSIQFLIILSFFRVELPFHILFAGTTWMFLIKSIVPALNIFADLGVREFSVLYFFDFYEMDSSKILLASLTLWLINILLPTILGTFFIHNMKIIRQ